MSEIKVLNETLQSNLWNKSLEDRLRRLCYIVCQTGMQFRIRQTLSDNEYQQIVDSYPAYITDQIALPGDAPARKTYEHFGRQNMEYLAEVRGIRWEQLIVDLAWELGALNEAQKLDFYNELGLVGVSPEKAVYYDDRCLKVNGELVARFRADSKADKLLSFMEENNWQNDVATPAEFQGALKSVTRDIRKRTAGFHIGEAKGGNAVHWYIEKSEFVEERT